MKSQRFEISFFLPLDQAPTAEIAGELFFAPLKAYTHQVKEYKMWITAFFEANHGHPSKSPFKGELKNLPLKGDRFVLVQSTNQMDVYSELRVIHNLSFLNLTRMPQCRDNLIRMHRF
ncbi:MAG: hypothetical protein DWQ05_06785 [Calditrichaeota bacterium]|nr:MAG: hypothetical protein DWQ05_06785 [Calditrichota bacterium]